MIEIEIYDTLVQAKQAKARNGTRHRNGFRPIHTNLINGKYEVTFVDGIDDPENDPANVAQRAQEKANQVRKEELKNKPNITLPEMRELLGLSL